jgi:hypothetical protein
LEVPAVVLRQDVPPESRQDAEHHSHTEIAVDYVPGRKAVVPEAHADRAIPHRSTATHLATLARVDPQACIQQHGHVLYGAVVSERQAVSTHAANHAIANPH